MTGEVLVQGEMLVATPKADGALAVVGRLSTWRNHDGAASATIIDRQC